MGIALQVCSAVLMVFAIIIIVSCLFLGDVEGAEALILYSVVMLCFSIFVFRIAKEYSEFTTSPEYIQYQLRIIQGDSRNGESN